MSNNAPADASAKTNQSSAQPSTKSSRVWPKLLLWSLVLAFGFLYLRSLDYPAKDYPQVEAPKPASPPPHAAPPPAAAQARPAAPPRPVAPPAPAMPQSWAPSQAASAPQTPATHPASAQPSPAPAKPSQTASSQPADAGQGAIKAAESEAFAQGVMRDQSEAASGKPQESQAAAQPQLPAQTQSGGASAGTMPQPRYPQPPAYGYGQPPTPAQPGTGYPSQYADYMRQQREAYEAARKRWEDAYGQPQQAPAYGGYRGYYPPGYYQGGR
ncbi:hypothetical protein [Thiorhodovibrio frisius]|uniref:Uncharacterized protein n=1 Tax=Thiorhodovibrio frisius TaxID=631362 RepID=H8Z498_9GAMM|nr:hypothetical protein [Thiorhodovibrio frisius]EIC20155.1 hypothetical protein Thi970DRAFT_03777 [Thiorhodovibrio frisius]WPL20892.1 hypothetical protein Thiofri_00998 [Thiorhodovibrio frisius]